MPRTNREVTRRLNKETKLFIQILWGAAQNTRGFRGASRRILTPVTAVSIFGRLFNLNSLPGAVESLESDCVASREYAPLCAVHELYRMSRAWYALYIIMCCFSDSTLKYCWIFYFPNSTTSTSAFTRINLQRDIKFPFVSKNQLEMQAGGVSSFWFTRFESCGNFASRALSGALRSQNMQ